MKTRARNALSRAWAFHAAAAWMIGPTGGLALAADATRPVVSDDSVFAERDGDGEVTVEGEPKQWHKVTVTLEGPYAHELDNDPNPFVDYEMNVTFTHESGAPSYVVPGYFAADGDAAETSAEAGTKWRAHLSPDEPGRWGYKISFRHGETVIDPHDPDSEPLEPYDGKSGQFDVAPSDKCGRDLRAHGRLQYSPCQGLAGR